MCRILVVPSIPKGKQEMVWKLFKAITPAMSENNNDGLGYAGMKANGNLFGERWLMNEHAWKFRQTTMIDPKAEEVKAKLVEKYGDRVKFPTPPKMYNKFGNFVEKDQIISAMLHTRFATCGKGILNTHPFVRERKQDKEGIWNEQIALIHNGMIRNDDDWKDQKITTNDSEAILCAYLEHFVQYKPEAMKDMLDDLIGYYAFSVMTTDKEDKPIVDLVRGEKADLVVAHIEELDTEVFCTREELITGVCKKLKWTINALSEVKEGSYFRFNALTGDIMYKKVFEPGPQWDTRTGGYYEQGKWHYPGRDKSLVVIPEVKKKEESSAFTPGEMHSAVAEVIAKINNKTVPESEKDFLQAQLIDDMDDEEFFKFYALQERMKSEDFTSDDPQVVSQYIKSMQK